MDGCGTKERSNPVSSYEETLVRLKKEFLDAQRLEIDGVSSGNFQQTALQLIQECERRRQDCVKQAEQLRMQAHAAESQSHAFSIVGSIMVNIVHGFVSNEERSRDEAAIRAKAAAEDAAEAASAVTTSENSDGASELEVDGSKPKKRVTVKK